MRKIIALLLCFVLIVSFGIASFAYSDTYFSAEGADAIDENKTPELDIDAKSAILMEADTGKILYGKNIDASLAPASVTKIMTLLLACEALEDGCFTLDTKVRISEVAAAMGGSQVFLEEGEEITVEELFKSTVIASANDSAAALAELVSGSVEAFVSKMNAKAMELSLKSTHFENVTGLDDTTVNHVMSAYDIAIVSRELLKYSIITKYSSLWQDSIRGGEFILTNTNRLVRYYDGCNGLKTGSTDKAGFCISATACRDGMQLIAVVMGAPTRDSRNASAKRLLDLGFSSYSLHTFDEEYLERVEVGFGKTESLPIYSAPFKALTEKGAKIERKYDIPSTLTAPIYAGEAVGSVKYYLGDKLIGEGAIYAKENAEELSFFELFLKMLGAPFRR
ncbi:MAG: D-alanyl-D-alanine carboxypeptidase [Clostridia bacterium]|nr:D-alanyl-D-alanine carboxypeptidase [Clostridia bacterium]